MLLYSFSLHSDNVLIWFLQYLQYGPMETFNTVYPGSNIFSFYHILMVFTSFWIVCQTFLPHFVIFILFLSYFKQTLEGHLWLSSTFYHMIFYAGFVCPHVLSVRNALFFSVEIGICTPSGVITCGINTTRVKLKGILFIFIYHFV